MALVEVIGNLIRELAQTSDLQSTTTSAADSTTTSTATPPTQKQLINFYDLLLSRTLDLSSYVRTKVLSTLTKLCELPVKFPRQRLAMTRAAVGMLEDKASGVRKGAETEGEGGDTEREEDEGESSSVNGSPE
jgi:condensin complex subunit 1